MTNEKPNRIEVHIPIKKSGRTGRAIFEPSERNLIRNCNMDSEDIRLFYSCAQKIHLWRDTADYVLVSDSASYKLKQGIISRTIPERFLVYERHENPKYQESLDREMNWRNGKYGYRGMA